MELVRPAGTGYVALQHYDIIEQLLTADLVVEDEASTGGGEPEKTAAGPKKDEEGDTSAKDETPK